MRTEDEGLSLIREARRRGTATLFATPHVTAYHPLTPSRRRDVERHWRAMAGPSAAAGVDLQLGWELGPHEQLMRHDPAELRLGELEACLLELPLPHIRHPDLRLTMRCVEHLEGGGLRIVIGHPERCDLVHRAPELLDELVERGCLLQVNATSLLGYHGPDCERTGWELVEEGRCSFIASDGHRAARPPFLDAAFERVAAALGDAHARRMFEGHALKSVPRSDVSAHGDVATPRP